MSKSNHHIDVCVRVGVFLVLLLNACGPAHPDPDVPLVGPAPEVERTLPVLEPEVFDAPEYELPTRTDPAADQPAAALPPQPEAEPLAFTVTASPAVVNAGDAVTLTVTVSNRSGKALKNLVYHDRLEPGLTYVQDDSSPVSFNVSNSEVTYSLPSVPDGGEFSFSYLVRVEQLNQAYRNGELWLHSASLTGSDQELAAQAAFEVVSGEPVEGAILAAVPADGGWVDAGDVSVYLPADAVAGDAALLVAPVEAAKGPEMQFQVSLLQTAPMSAAAEQRVAVQSEMSGALAEPAFMEVGMDQVVDLKNVPAGQEAYVATYDPQHEIWVKVPILASDYAANTVTVRAAHFSTWGAGLGSSMPQNGAGALLFDQPYTSLFTGAARYSVPVWTPPGRAGMAPSVSLSYSSATVDGVLGDVQAPWVGEGWNIDDTEVVRQIVTDANGYGYINSFALTLNGAVYPLTRDETHPSRYYVRQNAFLYVELHNEAFANAQGVSNATHEWWEVVTADGTRYRLGWNTDSEQLALMYGYACTAGGIHCNTPDGTYASVGYAGIDTDLVARRWRVDRVADLHGNYMEYHYTETQPAASTRLPAFDRSSYLESIAYTGYDGEAGHLDPAYQVHFVLGSRSAVGDVPTAYNVWDFVDDQLLDKIEICYQTCEHPVRTYDLGYTLAAAPNANGSLTLTSIAISGGGFTENGISIPETQAATVRFTYQNMPNRAVSGNDPFNYPRLTRIENGYGGKLTYTYETDGRGTDSWYDYRVQKVQVESGLGMAAVRAYAYQTPVYAGSGGNPALGELIGYTTTTETTVDYINSNAALMDVKHQFGTSGLDIGSELWTEQSMGGTVYNKTINTYVTDNRQAPFAGWNYRYHAQTES